MEDIPWILNQNHLSHSKKHNRMRILQSQNGYLLQCDNGDANLDLIFTSIVTKPASLIK